ncbi:MAG: BREX system P-loop protein BrxC [Methylococcaceae bacterium]|nr:BREX system P-loop protein BrxC [Methylococcaceae bacterium]
MKNRDIYLKDPIKNQLANNGVAEVKDDLSEQALNTLRYELDTFVCDGEYAKGLDKILSTFLQKVDQGKEQPGVWISGFYGSGKSHLAKMLRTLWVDYLFADGQSARHIAKLPTAISDHFIELSHQGKRYGGLHAASGTIGAGTENVRLALLGIVFKSAGLPEQYHLARFVMWLKSEGHYEQVKQTIESKGKAFHKELSHLYMSPIIANALLEVLPTLAANDQEVRQLLKAEYPKVNDVTNDQMIEAITDALTMEGKFPLTLIVLDEVQQYIDKDSTKAYQVQEVTETCSKHFGGKLLFVATGQNALSGTTSLSKLMGRFQVPVQLSDVDVESVIRKIILQKKETAKPDIQVVISNNLGEISRHLSGSKIEHHKNDEAIMLADYPILPVRRRFWEKVLRIIDSTGTVSQLRNQLKVIHEATQKSANESLGYVIGADFIYEQIASNLLQTGMISKEISEMIGKLSAGNEDEQLQSRLLALIYLIGKLPTDAIADIGVRATESMLADLLLEDLNAGSSELRKKIPELLQRLQEQGTLMALDTSSGVEYRLQTQESSQWHDTYRQQEAEFSGNMQRIENKREDLFHHQIQSLANTVRITQGKSKEQRSLLLNFDAEVPKEANKKIYLWVQDGWQTDEKSLIAEAQCASQDMPTIYLYIPARNKSELHKAIITQEAAQATLDIRGIPTTNEGKDARTAMETRCNEAKKHVTIMLKEIIEGIRIFQAGGTEIFANDLHAQLEQAAKASMIRLYRDFDKADHSGWGKVYDRARQDGAENALEALDYKGDTEKHPVCADILKYIGVSKKGAEIREHFKAAPYGWSQDAIDGGLFALLAAGILRAKDAAHKAVTNRTLERSKLTQASFEVESITIKPVQLIKVRKLITDSGINCKPKEEQDKIPEFIVKARQIAESAGGEAPKPAKADSTLLDRIVQESGNAQLLALYDHREELTSKLQQWQQTADKIAQRSGQWSTLKQLLQCSKGLAFHAELEAQHDAIIANRSLLDEPDPVATQIQTVTEKLRLAISQKSEQYHADYLHLKDQLDDNNNWQKLSESQQQGLLAKHDINEPESSSVNTVDEVIDSLEECSIQRWNDRLQAQGSKFDAAALEAAQLLEPKVQQIKLPRRTLKSEADIKAWLAEVEQQMLNDIQNGPLVV